MAVFVCMFIYKLYTLAKTYDIYNINIYIERDSQAAGFWLLDIWNAIANKIE